MKTKKIKLSEWASYTFKKDISGMAEYTTLFCDLELGMSLKDSKIFESGPIREALERCNATLKTTLDFVLFNKDGDYEILWRNCFFSSDVGICIEGLPYDLFHMGDCAEDETNVYLENWTESQIKNLVPVMMVDDALFIYREIDKEGGKTKEIESSSVMDLINEMMEYSLKQLKVTKI
jgi:hypothetical protein